MNYILKDKSKYYVAEGQATRSLANATRFSSIEDMLYKVPIMRDWNIDYELFSIEEDTLTIVEEKVWTKLHKQLKDDGKLKHFEGNIPTAFLRITTS